ncbi:MAG TPA: chloride channel protein, partial [Pseudobdellovibrionaceae bacterium]|nr:chloride channel protein [Pseudobdellovibrionaceae bacterium]
TQSERQSLLITAIGSSFGAAVGTPIAGIIFGIEVTRKKLPWYCLIENAIAAGAAFFVGRFLHVSHMHLPTFPFTLKIDTLWISLVGGIIFGLTARFFMSITHWLEKFLNQKIQNSYARIFWGGAIISTIVLMEGSMRFSGFGISTILSSLAHPLSWNIPVWKALLTILTLAVGFKGGEFMPLVFIGATLGSALSGLEPPVAMDSLQSLPYLGFVAVFAGAAKTPFAGTLMAMELFGPQFGPIAFICCWVSALVSGKPHIYHPSASRAQ